MQIYQQALMNDLGVRIAFREAGRRATVKDVLDDWQQDGPMARQFWSVLRQCDGPVFWEHPAWGSDRVSAAYECVLLKAPGLQRLAADRSSFAEHFTGGPVAAFRSLGGDAFLLAPEPQNDYDNYIDLYRFARLAPEQQRGQLLAAVSLHVRRLSSQRPLWLSTSGLGVGWLHVRIDSRPKYYQFSAYRRVS